MISQSALSPFGSLFICSYFIDLFFNVNADIGHLRSSLFSERMARDSTIYSYGRSFNGFAARLLPHEAKMLAGTYNTFGFDEIQRKRKINYCKFQKIKDSDRMSNLQSERVLCRCFRTLCVNFTQQDHGIS